MLQFFYLLLISILLLISTVTRAQTDTVGRGEAPDMMQAIEKFKKLAFFPQNDKLYVNRDFGSLQ